MSQILSYSFTPTHQDAMFDEIRCAAFEHAKRENCSGIALVLVSLPNQTDTIQVVANLGAGESSIVLPLPREVKETPIGTAFTFLSGMVLISEESALEAISGLETMEDMYVFLLDRASAQIRGFCCVNHAWVPIARSAEGAAAAAMVLHCDLENGTMESTIDQPGGLLEIGLRKENGKVTGLSAGGPVEVRA